MTLPERALEAGRIVLAADRDSLALTLGWSASFAGLWILGYIASGWIRAGGLDAVVLSAAAEAGCRLLLSEDLHHPLIEALLAGSAEG